MKITSQVSAVAFIVLATTALAAGDKEDVLIDNIVDAYGGDALTSIKTLKIQSQYKVPAVGQSASPDMLDFGLLRETAIIDYENSRSSELTWSLNNNGPRLGKIFNNGETGHSINFMRGTHVAREDYTYMNVIGGNMRMLDMAIVRVLNDNRDTAKYDGEVSYKGNAHYKLTYKMAETSDLTIFVDAKTNLISKMIRPGGLSYVYSQYRRQDGVTYASDTNFLIGGQPNLISIGRTLEINPDVTGAFDMPDGIATISGGMLDTSKMMAKEIANGVYIAGQRNAYSVFVDAGGHFIAVGGYPQLTKRFDAVKKLAGVDKPLKQQVVTHHHSDHIAGLEEIIGLGADLVTVAEHLDTVKGVLKSDVDDTRIKIVEKTLSLANGRVQVFDIATSHSDHFLLLYVPAAKLIFSADHFSTQVKNAPPGPSNGAVTFLKAIEALNLDIEYLYDAHTPHAFTMDQLKSVAGKYTGEMCLPGFAICADQ